MGVLGGLPGPGGSVCLVRGGWWCLIRGGCLPGPRGMGGLPGPGGVVVSDRGGVCLVWEGIPACTEADPPL